MLNNSPTNQTGFTLIMSLILLVVLTMLGLTSTQSTRTEIAMAGNLRESDMAFQVAEIGLTSAEIFIQKSSSKGDFNNPDIGLYSNTDDDPDYFDEENWEQVQESESVLTYALHQPRFIIKFLIDRSQNEVASVNIGGYGTTQPGYTVSNFRATSKGAGQTESASRMLQSYYGKIY